MNAFALDSVHQRCAGARNNTSTLNPGIHVQRRTCLNSSHPQGQSATIVGRRLPILSDPSAVGGEWLRGKELLSREVHACNRLGLTSGALSCSLTIHLYILTRPTRGAEVSDEYSRSPLTFPCCPISGIEQWRNTACSQHVRCPALSSRYMKCLISPSRTVDQQTPHKNEPSTQGTNHGWSAKGYCSQG